MPSQELTDLSKKLATQNGVTNPTPAEVPTQNPVTTQTSTCWYGDYKSNCR
jgi:hypothetical protein